MLLQCGQCKTTYDVEDSVLSEPGVVVECETCSVPLSPVAAGAKPPPVAPSPTPAPEPAQQAEATVMLAAFDAMEIKRMRPSGGGPAAPSRPARPARPAATFDEKTSMVQAMGELPGREPAPAAPAAPVPTPFDAPPPAVAAPPAPAGPLAPAAPAVVGPRAPAPPPVAGPRTPTPPPAAGPTPPASPTLPPLPPAVASATPGAAPAPPKAAPRTPAPAPPAKAPAPAPAMPPPPVSDAQGVRADAPPAESTIEEVGLASLAGLAAAQPKHRAAKPQLSPSASQYLDRPPGTPAPDEPAKTDTPDKAKSESGDSSSKKRRSPAAEAKRDKTPVDEAVPATPSGDAAGEGAGDLGEPPKLPIAMIAVAACLVLGMFVGSGVLVYKLATRGSVDSGAKAMTSTKASGKTKRLAGPRLSFKSALSLLVGRSDAMLATVRGGEFPAVSVPLVITTENLAIREVEVLQLEEGKVRRRDRQGFLLKPLVKPLMRELTDRTDGVGPMGRGANVLLILSESGVPFETVARVIFTAKSVGFRKLLLGGVDEENSRAASALPIEGPDWWPLTSNNAGDGLAVVADSVEGFTLFRRDGRPLTIDGEELPEVKIAKGMDFRIDKLAKKLIEVQKEARLRRVVLQPDKRVNYEMLLAMMAAIRGEDGELFEFTVLGGGGVL